jgi:steroid Delta-isomerase
VTQEAVQELSALAASQNSWRCVHAKDKAGWLALMADDILVEDPIGPSFTNPDGNGVRGKEALSGFYDSTIGAIAVNITCEETFPSSTPNEIAYILLLRFAFDNGAASSVRGVFTYRVNDEGLITNLRGYWNTDAMKFSKPGESD